MFLSAPSARDAGSGLDARAARRAARPARVWTLETLPPPDYPPSNASPKVACRLAGCAGVVVLGLRHVGSDPPRGGHYPDGPMSKRGWPTVGGLAATALAGTGR